MRFVLVSWFVFGAARAASPALVFVGDADPSGADEALLALGRSRGAPVARESLGNLGEEPRARLAKAVEAFARLLLPDARARLDALESEAAASGGAGLSRGELVELFATRATLRLTGGNEGGAWDDLLQVAAFSQGRPLDPARFPPRLIDVERRAAEALAAGGKLAFSAVPADATLFVDGLAQGRGAVELVLPAGRHFVRAERSGFTGAGRAIEVPPSGASLSLTLTPRPAPPMQSFVERAAQLEKKRSASRAERGEVLPRALASGLPEQVVGAWIGARGTTAILELALIEVATGQVRGRASLPLGPSLTDAALATALDLLVPPSSTAPPTPLYKRPWLWGVVGGVAAAAALSIGLGVGLSGGHVDGFSARVSLQGAR